MKELVDTFPKSLMEEALREYLPVEGWLEVADMRDFTVSRIQHNCFRSGESHRDAAKSAADRWGKHRVGKISALAEGMGLEYEYDKKEGIDRVRRRVVEKRPVGRPKKRSMVVYYKTDAQKAAIEAVTQSWS